MLNKLNKVDTQKLIKENLTVLKNILMQQRSEDLEPKESDILKIKKYLVVQNIDLIIESAFRGDEEKESINFDITTELMENLKPFFNKSIGDKRKEQIEKIIGEYFSPVEVKGLKIKCYISWYYNKIQFLILENGFSNGSQNNINGIYFSPQYTKENKTYLTYPLDFKNLTATRRIDYKYTEISELRKTAVNYYNKQLKAAKKIKTMLKEIQKITNQAMEDVPHEVRALKENYHTTDNFTNNLQSINYYENYDLTF